MHGHDENAELGLLGEHELDQLQSIRAGQVDIDQGDVGREIAHGLERAARVLRLAADVEVGLFGKESGHAAAQQGMIVDDQDAVTGIARRGLGWGGRTFHEREAVG